jgi:tRNA (guanine37-N1)-methyltransferase
MLTSKDAPLAESPQLRFCAVTLFPEMFRAVTDFGVTGRAIKRNLVSVSTVNPRDFTEDKHRTVDDRPYGGGPGMLMKVEPLEKALNAARETFQNSESSAHVVYLSPQGRPLNQTIVKELIERKNIILLAGRYEGIDERLIESQVDEEISLGDFVLSGGELAAMAVMDAMIRMLPEALGHQASAEQDSFADGLLDCPHYTRPEELNGKRVPEVLLSGNHAAIERWRMKQSLGRTWQRRPELLAKLELTAEQRQLLDEFKAEQKQN